MRRTVMGVAIALVAVAGWWGWSKAQGQEQAVAGAAQVVVKGASKVPVVFDGHVSKFEYGDAAHTTFVNGHGTVDVYSKCVDGVLYFGFQIPDLSPFGGDDIVIMVDPANQRAAVPGKDVMRAYVRRKMENSRMQRGIGDATAKAKWTDDYQDWEYRSALYSTGWEVEARIPLKSLGAEVGKSKTMGLAFRIWDNQPQKMWNWPVGSNEDSPATWGTLVVE